MSKYEIITVGNLRTDSIYFLGSPPRAATATNDDKKPIKVWRRLGLIETPSIVFCVPFQPFSGSSNWWVCSTSIILNERTPERPRAIFYPGPKSEAAAWLASRCIRQRQCLKWLDALLYVSVMHWVPMSRRIFCKEEKRINFELLKNSFYTHDKVGVLLLNVENESVRD